MELVKNENGKLLTSSLIVAEVFSKRHDSVLRTIKELDCSDEFKLHHFVEVEYLDGRNRKQKAYAMTRDGFSFLAMGFTGKQAAKWKEKYIEAFNAMEAALKSKDNIANTKKHLKRYEVNKKNIPNGYFSMIEEAIFHVILPLELDGKDLIDKCLPDGSLGKGFCSFLKSKGFDTTKLPTYKHHFEDGRVVNANLYPDEVLQFFKQYLRAWVDGNGKKYFQDRVKRLGN